MIPSGIRGGGGRPEADDVINRQRRIDRELTGGTGVEPQPCGEGVYPRCSTVGIEGLSTASRADGGIEVSVDLLIRRHRLNGESG